MTRGDQIEHRPVAGTSVAAVGLGLAPVCYTRLVVVAVLELYYLASRYTPPEFYTAPDTVTVRNLQSFVTKPAPSKRATQNVHNGFHLC